VEFAENGFSDRSGDEGMSDSVKEQLSACLDGELADQELDLLLKRVGRDAEVRQSIGRYALIGEALRGQAHAPSKQFAERLMAAIDSEPAIDSVPARRSARSFNRFARPLSGLAIAASVAVAVLSIQRIAQPPDSKSIAPAVTVAAAPQSPEPSYVVPATTQDVSFVPATRLTNYVVAHSEYTSPLSRRTLLSGVLSEDDDVSASAASNVQVKVTSDDGASDDGDGSAHAVRSQKDAASSLARKH
jgi:sigma-E factor negative regulatory protein RseA